MEADFQVLAPDLPYHPDDAIRQLRGLIGRYSIQALVGSSLGGFYATSLNAQAPLPTVLINPVVRPHELLAGYLGVQRRWCDGARFEVGEDYLQALACLQRDRLAADERYLVLLQQGDETLDYRQAAAYYRDKEVVQRMASTVTVSLGRNPKSQPNGAVIIPHITKVISNSIVTSLFSRKNFKILSIILFNNLIICLYS